MYNSEDRFQSDCYLWFHETYPSLRGLLCYNLNNSRNRIRAMMDKSMGLQKGRADMVFYYAGKAYHIELKAEGGKKSKEQKKWQEVIENAGFTYVVIWDSLEAFQNYIKGIIK
jgi:hypothetical protein